MRYYRDADEVVDLIYYDEQRLLFCKTGKSARISPPWNHLSGIVTLVIALGVQGLKRGANLRTVPAMLGIWYQHLKLDEI